MKLKALLIAVALMATVSPAVAECYDEIGCTDEDYFDKSDLRDYSCKALWVLRNTMYYEHGYCFETQRAINYFGNDECYEEDGSDIRFNKYERQNIESIKSVERQKGC